MTPVLEALLVAALAGTLASVTAGFINRAILKFKKRMKARRGKPDQNPDESFDIDVVIE
jgi:hypothetical protein